jgi:hypothetical protein
MRWYLNQTVSLYEFGTVERAFSPACQTNCFQGEASAAYDPCGNMISLVAQATIHPSYDQSINGPIEFHIPEQGQWELKEQLANLTKNRAAFPNDESLLKILFLAIRDVSKKWTKAIPNWPLIISQFSIIFKERLDIR